MTLARFLPLLGALVLALPSTALAGETSRLGDIKSRSDDAARIVAKILLKEEDKLERCGDEYMESRPRGPALVQIKIRLSSEKAQVMPLKAKDAERPEVRCVGKRLAGIDWPRPSGKVDVTVDIVLGKAGKKRSSDDEVDDLDDDDDDDRDRRRKRDRDDDDEDFDDLDDLDDDDDDDRDRRRSSRDDDRRRDDDRPRDDDRRRKKSYDDDLDDDDDDDRDRRRSSRDDDRRRDDDRPRDDDRRRRDRDDDDDDDRRRRDRDDDDDDDEDFDLLEDEGDDDDDDRGRSSSRRKSKDSSSPDWRNRRVGYVNGIAEGLSEKEVARGFDDLLEDIDRLWKKARSNKGMLKVSMKVNEDGFVEDVEVLKSRDIDDIERSLVRLLGEAEFDEPEGRCKIEWTFAFKR